MINDQIHKEYNTGIIRKRNIEIEEINRKTDTKDLRGREWKLSESKRENKIL